MKGLWDFCGRTRSQRSYLEGLRAFLRDDPELPEASRAVLFAQLLPEYDEREATLAYLDDDRTWWGDPAADWPIRMVMAKSYERQAFWETYGPLNHSEDARWRQQIYEARHLGAIRLERHRLGNHEGVAASYDSMVAILAAVG